MSISGWRNHCQNYPDKAVVAAIVGIAQYGARIGFQGIREGHHLAQNLVSAYKLPEILRGDLQEQMENDRLIIYE